jgi:hypothetical protein
MATCPHCLGPLTDTHRCPRRRHVRAMMMALSALAGGASGFVTMAILDPGQASTHLDIWVIAGGMFIGAALYQVLASRSA